MEEVNTGKESKEAGESVRGWYNSFNSKNREHWEAEWDVRGTLVAESTDWKGSNQKKKKKSEIQLGLREKRGSLFQFLISMRSNLPHPLSLLLALLWRSRVLDLVCKFTKYDLATSQLHSSSPWDLPICRLSCSCRSPDSAGEGLYHHWLGWVWLTLSSGFLTPLGSHVSSHVFQRWFYQWEKKEASVGEMCCSFKWKVGGPI